MQTPLSIEKQYVKKYLELHKEIYKRIFNELSELDLSSIKDGEITQPILHRMCAYYNYQNETNKLLKRSIVPSAADFFTETVLFYLSAYIKANKIPLIAKSEKLIKVKNINLKPDISLWSLDEQKLMGFIECKTQLGWNRSGWREEMEERVKLFEEEYGNILSYYVVFTNSNWQGFQGDKEENKRYFCLTDLDIKTESFSSIPDIMPTLNNIEPMLREIKEKLSSRVS